MITTKRDASIRKKNVVLVLPEEMLARLEMLASKLDCSRNYLLVQLIETGMLALGDTQTEHLKVQEEKPKGDNWKREGAFVNEDGPAPAPECPSCETRKGVILQKGEWTCSLCGYAIALKVS